jgi:hypothetical protein
LITKKQMDQLTETLANADTLYTQVSNSEDGLLHTERLALAFVLRELAISVKQLQLEVYQHAELHHQPPR